MTKLARAAQHAHERGVLHRDLKPGNVLFDASGEPMLTDFGLAKLADVESGLTQSSAHLGTPQYMSPEQAQGGARDVTVASDVWALGVMLYQMLSGRVPFNGESHQEIFRRILVEEPSSVTISEATQSTSRRIVNRKSQIANAPDLSTIVMRCLEKEPARRLPSAAFLADELERWLAGEPIRSRPIAPAERVWKWTKRHPYRVAAVGLIVGSLLAGSITSLVLWRRAEASATEARWARDAAEEDAYFATVANALTERERFDFGAARRTLAGIPPARRGFEWQLVNGLCRGAEDWVATFDGATPKCLALDRATDRVMVITDDRRLHALDPDTGRGIPAGRVPEPPPRKPGVERLHGFRELGFAPDGRHYFVTEGNQVFVVETASGGVVFTDDVPWVTACWLGSGQLIFGYKASVKLGQKGPDTWADSAWIFDLAAGTTTPLPPRYFTGPFALSGDGRRLALARGGGVGREVRVYVGTMLFEQSGYVNGNPNYPNFFIRGSVAWIGGYPSVAFKLGNAAGGTFTTLLSGADNWVNVYDFNPQSLNGGVNNKYNSPLYRIFVAFHPHVSGRIVISDN